MISSTLGLSAGSAFAAPTLTLSCATAIRVSNFTNDFCSTNQLRNECNQQCNYSLNGKMIHLVGKNLIYLALHKVGNFGEAVDLTQK
jgi:hypothetical protein